MFDGAPESWVVASIAAVEALQGALGSDHALALVETQFPIE
jgi:hypothetical protein